VDDRWYKNALIYELSVRTYADGNGDGVGDFRGLSERLDYLAALGVNTVWLSPFYASPWRDDGYDITDFYAVHPDFGDLGDFVRFVEHADDRGIRVLVDLVLNHTSDRHPWFRDGRRRDSPLHDWYVWSTKHPANWRSGIVFPGVQKRTWTFDRVAREYFFHRFYDFQPDLDMDNPRVREEVRRIIGFWLQLGVAGFRVDAVPFVLEKPPRGRSKRQIHFEYLREFREFLQWRERDAIILAEANVEPDVSPNYFGDDGDRLQLMFNFWVNQRMFYALATGDSRPLAKSLEQTRDHPSTAQWAHFLRNHDELDLGRLTDAQRQRVFEAMGPEKNMQLYDRGIRRRLAPMLHGDRRRLELAYSLLFTLPGTPVIRYGDELGMGDNLRLKERNCARTPMQWSTEPHAGFTRSDEPVLPVISDGPYGYDKVNAADQRRDPESLLNWTERIIRMRKEVPEIGWGEFEVVETGDEALFALRYNWRNNSVLVVHNLSGDAREATIHLGDQAGRSLANLLTHDHSEADGRGRHHLILEPYGYRWYRIGGLGYLLDRSVV
jgi:maltose alpha-D-glucosyltransferase / alpha-amylase